MDLNELYERHQIALMRAEAAASPKARAEHRERADAYVRMIDDERQRNGASDGYSAWDGRLRS